MIYDSAPWKEELLKTAKALQRRRTGRRWSEATFYRLEKEVMLGFYSIRKLYEAQKLSTATMKQPVTLSFFPWLGRPVTLLNWDKIDRLYDMESKATKSHDLLFICHQIVHSYVFIPVFDDTDLLVQIAFASDRQRHQGLLGLDFARLVEFFKHVGQDYPASATYAFDEKRADYDVDAK